MSVTTSATDPSLWPPIITAASGLVGALIGGGATLLATWLTANATQSRARAELPAAKAEQLVTLLCRGARWYDRAEVGLNDPRLLQWRRLR